MPTDTAQRQMVRCEARTHAVVVDGRYLRFRCTERSCPDVREAKSDGGRVFHIWDLHTMKMVRTDVERERAEKRP